MDANKIEKIKSMSPYLMANEEIEWMVSYGLDLSRFKNFNFNFDFLIPLIAFFVFSFLVSPVFVLILILFLLFVIFLFFLLSNSESKKFHYLTNKRILVGGVLFKNKYDDLFYENIVSIEIQDLGIKNQTVKINTIEPKSEKKKRYEFTKVSREDANKMGSLLYAKIKEHSFRELHEVFQTFENEYGFTYIPYSSPFDRGGEQNPCLKGVFEGMEFEVRYKGVFTENRRLNIQVTCPNKQNNAFKIIGILKDAALKKMYYGGSFETGNRSLDKKFVFLSENTSFLKNIVSEEVQKELIHIYLGRSGILEFGNVEDLKKNLLKLKRANLKGIFSSKSKPDNLILDAHLIQETEEEISLDLIDDLQSILKLELSYHNSFSHEEIARYIKRSINLILALAHSIKIYDD